MAPLNDTQLARALRVTPNASQTRSKAPGNVGPLFGPGEATDFPLFASHGHGAYLWDSRGRQYLDCVGANAAVPLGYAFPPVVEAIEKALRRGSLLSLPHMLEAEVSDRFIEVCAPWAHQARWVKTGSEAVHAAVLIARAHTHRSVVLVADSSYHGWHSWFQACKATDMDGRRVHAGLPHGERYAWCPDDTFANGTPLCYGHTVAVYHYGDLDSMKQAAAYAAGVSQRPGRAKQSCVAAVLIEAHRWEPTDRAWLLAVRDWCRANGALLIFDEMVYGLRWAKGGATEYFGVEPDLACFGKALGNGVPVACVCGATQLMQHAELVSGTYGGDALGLAAAHAVLQEYARRDVVGELWATGRALWQAFCQATNLTLEGSPLHWRLPLHGDQLDRALALAAEAGVLVHRAANNASAAADVQTWARAGKVLGEACLEVRR